MHSPTLQITILGPLLSLSVPPCADAYTPMLWDTFREHSDPGPIQLWTGVCTVAITLETILGSCSCSLGCCVYCFNAKSSTPKVRARTIPTPKVPRVSVPTVWTSNAQSASTPKVPWHWAQLRHALEHPIGNLCNFNTKSKFQRQKCSTPTFGIGDALGRRN